MEVLALILALWFLVKNSNWLLLFFSIVLFANGMAGPAVIVLLLAILLED